MGGSKKAHVYIESFACKKKKKISYSMCTEESQKHLGLEIIKRGDAKICTVKPLLNISKEY